MKKSQFISLAILLVIVSILLIIGATNRGEKDPIIKTSPTSTPKPTEVSLQTPTPEGTQGDGTATPEPTMSTPTPTPVKTPVVFPTVDKGYIGTLSTGTTTWYSSVTRDSQGYSYPVFNDILKPYLNGIDYIFTKPVEGKKTIYLTFNEGYDDSKLRTEKILDILKNKNVKATFYLTQEYMNIESNHPVIRRMVNEGHAIGSRGSASRQLHTLSVDDAIQQLLAMEDKLQKILNDNTVRMTSYRHIEYFSQRTLGIANQLGYVVSLWSFNYNDWNELNAAAELKAYREMVDNLYDGAVFNLTATSVNNVNLLPDLIDEARAQGYVFEVIKK